MRIHCVRVHKADSYKKGCGYKNIRILADWALVWTEKCKSIVHKRGYWTSCTGRAVTKCSKKRDTRAELLLLYLFFFFAYGNYSPDRRRCGCLSLFSKKSNIAGIKCFLYLFSSRTVRYFGSFRKPAAAFPYHSRQ